MQAVNTTQEPKFSMPTETIDLPSKGLVYPEGNPLAAGKIEMKYMGAKEEDILTNQSYIANGTVLDKLMQSLIVTKINYDDLIVGDKNAIMVAARILGYGKDYTFEYDNETQTVDLSQLDTKEFDGTSLPEKGKNEFEYVLPNTGTEVTYKILTHGDEKKIQAELDGLKKVNKNASPELSTRLKFMITSVGGERDAKVIREFVDKHLLAMDSRALRKHIKETQPDIDLTFFPEGSSTRVDIPIGLKFFWPDL